MEGLGKHLGFLWGARIGMQRHRGKTGNEHDLERRIEFGGPTGELDTVHLGHHDIGQKQVVGALLDLFECAGALAEGNDGMTGALQSADQKAAHVLVVLSQNDLGHHIPGLFSTY